MINLDNAIVEDEIYFYLCLRMVKSVGNIRAKQLLSFFKTPQEIFKASKKDLQKTEMGESVINEILSFKPDKEKIDAELEFIKKHHIKVLLYGDASFPKKLLQCPDAPFILFQLGDININDYYKTIAIVGTRKPSKYGLKMTQDIVDTFKENKILVFSGLAEGIDTESHICCVKNNIPTIAVLGHGLHTCFPAANKKLAKDIIQKNGALLTEYTSYDTIEPSNFPERNRIIAGCSDATIVVESKSKGGSLITANVAFSYNRDVFAVPGKIGDTNSEGCNLLIQNQIAQIVNHPADITKTLGWQNKTTPQTQKENYKQNQLFQLLTPNQKTIIEILKQKENTHIDDIMISSNLSHSTIAAELLQLELQGIIEPIKGKFYALK